MGTLDQRRVFQRENLGRSGDRPESDADFLGLDQCWPDGKITGILDDGMLTIGSLINSVGDYFRTDSSAPSGRGNSGKALPRKSITFQKLSKIERSSLHLRLPLKSSQWSRD